MVNKFRIFRHPILASPEKVQSSPEKVTKIIKATSCLHNYMKISEACNPSTQRHYCPSGYTDHEDQSGHLVPGNWRLLPTEGIHQMGSTTFLQSAAELWDTIMEYFTSTQGSVPWQVNHVCSCGRQSFICTFNFCIHCPLFPICVQNWNQGCYTCIVLIMRAAG